MTTFNKSLSIRPLEPADAAAIVGFMRSQSPDYIHFFYAFGADESAIAKMLSASGTDVYSGIFWQTNLIGVFMLRGWDAGYEVPAFGILVDEKYSGGAFFRLALDIVKLTCRLSGTKRLMAKCHPDNISPKGARRLGFHQTGVEESTGNIIYHLDL